MISENASTGFKWLIEEGPCDEFLTVEYRLSKTKEEDPYEKDYIIDKETNLEKQIKKPDNYVGRGNVKYIHLKPKAPGQCLFRMANAREWEFSWDQAQNGNSLRIIEIPVNVHA